MTAPLESPRILDPREWSRAGRGREQQFFATDAEVRAYLRDLPAEFGPYDTLGQTMVPNPVGSPPYRREEFVCSVDEHFERLDRGLPIPMNIFIRPAALVPLLPIAAGADVDAWCAVNGLVLLQHGQSRKGKREASRVAIIDKVVNRAGEVVTLTAQTSIFEHLKRRIRRDLRYASVHVFKDGHAEESTLQLMTAAAAELAKTGFFDATAGRLVR